MNFQYPTAWQKKIIWSALTAFCFVTLGAIAVFLIWLSARVLGFLQPILIPFAVAAVLAYLLEPVVKFLTRCKYISRTSAVLLVFGAFMIGTTLILIWIIPEIYHQSSQLAEKVPGYVEQTRQYVVQEIDKYQDRFGNTPYVDEATQWAKQKLPGIIPELGKFLKNSAGGFLGFTGYILGLIIIPVYLFFFLKDATRISEHWSQYLPLRASSFKDEVVSVLTEINGYLIAFFRGQLVVSIVDGILTGVGLVIMGLNFGLLIGLMVCILALIPYLGILLCWIPAVIIAAVQWGDWQHPMYVTLIFIGVQQIEGLFIAPKIVGESVGLHPLTVIFAVLAWSLLIGGLLGAILAVPLTATLKVLLKRYVWEKKFKTETLLNVPSSQNEP